MNDKTKRNAKLNAIITAAQNKTASLIETRDAINAQIEANEVSDVDMLRKMRMQVCNAESRASRSQKIATLSDADASTFALFCTLHKTDDAVAAFFARAIYVQDKLRATIAALARKTTLASVTRNHSTRVVLRELLNADASRKHLLASLVRDCSMTANTASSQVSSSLIALQHLNIVTQDAATRDYAIRDEETALALIA